jgi:hypothetical protein
MSVLGDSLLAVITMFFGIKYITLGTRFVNISPLVITFLDVGVGLHS